MLMESTQKPEMAEVFFYLRGMNLDEWVAPIPGRPCLTGLYVMENSPK